MCIIIDANFFSQLVAAPDDAVFAQVVTWLEQRGGIVVFGGRLRNELRHNARVRRYLDLLASAGRARRVADATVDAEEPTVMALGPVSDDPHVLALARVGRARTLCSFDQDLHSDFKDATFVDRPRGSVYTAVGHRHLLRHRGPCL